MDRLSQIKARLGRAWPGRRTVGHDHIATSRGRVLDIDAHATTTTIPGMKPRLSKRLVVLRAEADLIESAHDDMTWLVKELEAAREKLKALEPGPLAGQVPPLVIELHYADGDVGAHPAGELEQALWTHFAATGGHIVIRPATTKENEG